MVSVTLFPLPREGGEWGLHTFGLSTDTAPPLTENNGTDSRGQVETFPLFTVSSNPLPLPFPVSPSGTSVVTGGEGRGWVTVPKTPTDWEWNRSQSGPVGFDPDFVPLRGFPVDR